MTFAPSNTLTQDAVGRRMMFLASDDDIRNDALQRLQAGEDLIQIAKTLTKGALAFNVFDDDMVTFADNLEELFGRVARGAYLNGDALLDTNKRDTPENRAHILEFWQGKAAAAGVEAQIRQAFIDALNSPGPLRIRWGDSRATGKLNSGAVFKAVGGQQTVVMTVEPLA